MLRLPARTRIARRPPNSGMVVASSISRAGSDASVSPSSRTSANGSVSIVDRGADDRIDALADKPGVGPEHQHDRARGIGARDEGFDLGGF